MFYNQPSVGGEGWYVCSAPQRPAPSLNPPLPPGGRLPYKGGFNGDPDDPPPPPRSCLDQLLGDSWNPPTVAAQRMSWGIQTPLIIHIYVILCMCVNITNVMPLRLVSSVVYRLENLKTLESYHW
eukprot:4836070-Pyramimonas_sp.AAC.1